MFISFHDCSDEGGILLQKLTHRCVESFDQFDNACIDILLVTIQCYLCFMPPLKIPLGWSDV